MSRQQQVSTATFRRRHLTMMRDVANILAARPLPDGAKPKVLSYGCSNGSECLDLADELAGAEIYGCDVSPKALAAARQACEGRAVILESGSAELREVAPFDAVFALNVFCRHPQAAGHDDVSGIYPFALFEEGMADLDSLVKPGGVLALYNAQYFFEDAAASSRYRPFLDGVQARNGWIEKALPDGQRITDVDYAYGGESFDREGWTEWLRDPANAQKKKEALADMDLIFYRHTWIEPGQAEGRSTRHALWIKEA